MKKILLSVTIFNMLFFISNAQNVPSYIPVNGLVGWWPLSGNALDSSGNANNGLTYNVSFANDRFGTPSKAAYFNGSSSYIEVSNSSSLSLSSAYSISLWFKASQWSFLSPIDEHALVSKIVDGNWYGGYEIRQGGNAGGVHHTGNINGNFYIGTLGADTGIWYNVITSFNGNTVKFYLNGILKDSIYSPGNIQTSTTPLRFGRRGGAGYYNCWYNGLIDDVAIWNRALSQSEINSIVSFNPLPIILTNFMVTKDANYPTLSWSTISEKNNKGFLIEKSTDSKDWISIGFVSGMNNNTLTRYSFKDNTFIDSDGSVMYYRLKQIDFDGRSEYSKILTYSTKTENVFTIHPNPFYSKIIVNGEFDQDKLISVEIYDLTGAKLETNGLMVSNDNSKFSIDGLAELKSGIYILRLKSATSINNFRIIKL